jgi:hypothetical protein
LASRCLMHLFPVLLLLKFLSPLSQLLFHLVFQLAPLQIQFLLGTCHELQLLLLDLLFPRLKVLFHFRQAPSASRVVAEAARLRRPRNDIRVEKFPTIVPARAFRFCSALSAPSLPDEFTGPGQVFHDLPEVFVISLVKVADNGITCLVGLCY